jgi:hypothetical protein
MLLSMCGRSHAMFVLVCLHSIHENDTQMVCDEHVLKLLAHD